MEDYRRINGEQQNKKKKESKTGTMSVLAQSKKKVNQASTQNTRFLTCMRTHTHTHKKQQQQKDVYIHEHTHIIIPPLESEMKSESVSC